MESYGSYWTVGSVLSIHIYLPWKCSQLSCTDTCLSLLFVGHGHSSNQNQPNFQPELVGRSVHQSPLSPALMFSSCQEGRAQGRSRRQSPFPEPFLAVVFSSRWFFPNPSLRGAWRQMWEREQLLFSLGILSDLDSHPDSARAPCALPQTVWSFSVSLCSLPICLNTSFFMIFQFLHGVCTFWRANMVALLCLAPHPGQWFSVLVKAFKSYIIIFIKSC